MQIKSVFISNTTKLWGAWIYSLFMTSQTALQCKNSLKAVCDVKQEWSHASCGPSWSLLLSIKIQVEFWSEKYKYIFDRKIQIFIWGKNWGKQLVGRGVGVLKALWEHILKQISTRWWSCPTSKFCTVNCHNWLNEQIANSVPGNVPEVDANYVKVQAKLFNVWQQR